MADEADVIVYAEPDELRANEVYPNRGRKRASEHPERPSVEYEELLVKPALVRSSTYNDKAARRNVGGLVSAAYLLRQLLSSKTIHVWLVVTDAYDTLQAIHDFAGSRGKPPSVSHKDIARVVLLTSGRRYYLVTNAPRPRNRVLGIDEQGRDAHPGRAQRLLGGGHRPGFNTRGLPAEEFKIPVEAGKAQTCMALQFVGMIWINSQGYATSSGHVGKW